MQTVFRVYIFMWRRREIGSYLIVTRSTHISDSASNITTPSHKSDRSSGGWVTEKKTFPKNSQTALARGSSSASAMISEDRASLAY